jgi:hypothetical protein
MRKSILLIFIILFCTSILKSQSNKIFEFELYDGLRIEDVSVMKEKLEYNVNRIMTDLGLDTTKTETFKVHVWHVKESFLTAMEKKLGTRYPNSSGYVFGYSEIAVLFIDNPQEMINATGLLYCFTPEEIAEHEFAHCLSMHVNPSLPNNPRWFWETVAIYESNEFYNPNRLSYLTAGEYPTINDLNSNFNNGDYRIYQVGYLIGEFIVSEWGKDKYIALIKNLGNVSYVLNISNQEFEEKWKNFVNQKYFGITNVDKTLNKDFVFLLNTHSVKLFYNDDLLTGGTIRIFDLNGKIISSNKIIETPININLNYLSNGIFLVSINKGNILLNKKIVLAK